MKGIRDGIMTVKHNGIMTVKHNGIMTVKHNVYESIEISESEAWTLVFFPHSQGSSFFYIKASGTTSGRLMKLPKNWTCV